jgi:hypothetical protein
VSPSQYGLASLASIVWLPLSVVVFMPNRQSGPAVSRPHRPSWTVSRAAGRASTRHALADQRWLDQTKADLDPADDLHRRERSREHAEINRVRRPRARLVRFKEYVGSIAVSGRLVS